MKLFHTITAGLLLCAGLVSCEMKDELKGGSTDSSDTGYLELGVSVNTSQNNVTRADVTDDGTGSATSGEVGNFPVAITGVTDATFNKNFTSYTELLAANPVQLPVGNYTVTAHSNLTLQTVMSVPYYEGTENITITKDVYSSATVKCTMKNTKIQLVLPSAFIAAFPTWTITVDDGTENILTFDDSEPSPAAVYWLVSENVTTLNVDITGTNLNGEAIYEKRELTKPAGSSSNYWTGGDALTITFEATTPDPENPSGIQGSGIDIKVDLEFDETGETVDVPVTGGGTQPEEPEEGDPETGSKPKIDLPQTTYTLPDDTDTSEDAIATIKAEAGLKSVVVKITPDTDAFQNALALLLAKNINFMEGVDLVAQGDDVAPVIGIIAQGLEMPEANEVDYTFPVGAFFATLGSVDMGVTTAVGHRFDITVTDNNNQTATANLNIVVDSVE